VLVFELTYTVNEEGSSPNTLKLLCGHSGNINVLHLRVHNNIIAVADVMRGVSLMLFRRKASERQSDSLLQIARDETPVWTMALAALSDAQFLVSTNNMNLLTVSRNKEATDVETRARLLMSGGIHLGHYVNQIRRGWIGHEPTATENSGIVDSHLFACQSGMIGVVASLKKTKFEFLEKLEQVLLNGKYVCAVGGLVHSSYRNFMYQMQNVHHIKEGFVDGDVVEQVLTLSRPQREAVAAKMQVTVQELQAEVADMLRLV
jgi:hypothetical protein